MKVRLVIYFLTFSTLCWLSPSWFKLSYDSSGIRGLIFWTCQVLGFPFWAISEFLFTLHRGKAFPYQDIVSIVFVWCLVVVLLMAFHIRRKLSRPALSEGDAPSPRQ